MHWWLDLESIQLDTRASIFFNVGNILGCSLYKRTLCITYTRVGISHIFPLTKSIQQDINQDINGSDIYKDAYILNIG